jgi:hypothetical protein
MVAALILTRIRKYNPDCSMRQHPSSMGTHTARTISHKDYVPIQAHSFNIMTLKEPNKNVNSELKKTIKTPRIRYRRRGLYVNNAEKSK